MNSAAPGGAGRSDRVEIGLAQAMLQSFGEVGRGGWFVLCAHHADCSRSRTISEKNTLASGSDSHWPNL
eukprot:7274562-Prorocentrum_lima.AAC.1